MRQSDRDAGQRLLDALHEIIRRQGGVVEAGATVQDDGEIVQTIASVRQQAEDAMRERCLAAVTRYRENCCYDEEMDAADVIATAIRGIDAGGEGE